MRGEDAEQEQSTQDSIFVESVREIYCTIAKKDFG
jgi:hypothetical protein